MIHSPHQTIAQQTIGKEILHRTPHEQFLVGQSMQGSIGTYRDNIHKFIAYMQLILSFMKKFIQK